MNKIWIVIVSYNGMQWLPKSLASTKPYPVIIVDNNSSDGTVNYIKNNYSEIRLFEQEKNLGFGQANNIGINYALQNGAGYVFLLNQDAYLGANIIENLIEVQRKNRNFGILSPIHLNGNGEFLDRNFSHYVNFDKNPDFYSDYILHKPKKEAYEVPFVNAAGWLLSKQCLETVGGFDPIFYHYGEDDNYCQRLKYHGFKIGVVPNVYIKHDRVIRKINKFLNAESYLDKQERLFKIKYANINEDTFLEISDTIGLKKKAKLKSLCKFDLHAVRHYSKEIFLLKRISAEICRSREINKSIGLNYLKNYS